MNASLQELVRDVTDLGLRVRLRIPSSWSEVDVDGTILFVGGRLEDDDQTLVPTVQLRAETAADADAARAAVSGVAQVLRDAVVVFETSGQDAAGYPETVAEIAHRSDVTDATQISMFRTIYLQHAGVALSVIATCGGAASEAARDTLRDVVTSVSVDRLEPSSA